jgi:hypothetical protein
MLELEASPFDAFLERNRLLGDEVLLDMEQLLILLAAVL